MKYDMDYLLDEFCSYLLIEKTLSKNTINAYNKDILQYFTYIKKQFSIDDVNDIELEHITEFFAYLHDLKMKSSSIARKMSAIKMYHKFLFLNNYIESNVSSFIKQPKLDKDLPVVFSIEEIDSLLNTFNKENIFEFRRSEEHTSELQSRPHLVCRLLLEKKNTK